MKTCQNILRLRVFLRNSFFIGTILFLCIASLSSCNDDNNEKKYIIGFSQCVESDKWRKAMLEGMKRELAFHPNVKWIYRQADANNQNQISQVKELLSEKINLLIISPNEAQPLTPVVEEVFNKGIPVIVIDRKISSSLYSAYVGANNYELGKIAGEYAASLLKRKGKIVEVKGLPGSSPTLERGKGFAESIQKYPSLQIVKQVYGDWIKQKTQEELSKIPSDELNIDLVFAFNDVMASAAHEVLSKRKPVQNIFYIGVDALPGPAAGMQFVSDKTLTASLLYPTGGEEAIQLAMKILSGESFNKENYLNTSIVDSTNVRLLKLQTDKIDAQQYDIERQQKMIDEQIRIYNNQRTFLNILIATLIIAVALGAIAFYSLRTNRKINKKLKAQNEEISNQKNQLVEMSAKAQEANEAKIKFFTNISHEFRTPLTLILGPLEELLQNEKIYRDSGQSLLLMHKNAIRLLRLINQLMDFRKIEFDKLKLRVSENDIVVFLNQIIEAYRELAKKRNIDLRLITKQSFLTVWFDETMLDKVLFNLLSNAFKFTSDDGYIYVFLEKDEAGDNVEIIVEDNGVGMTKTTVEHAFELFYQGEYENYKGSGLGLALSKELIRLHKGTIKVESEKWKGTKFRITLPLGDTHLEKHEIISKEISNMVLYEDEKIYTTELLPQVKPEESFIMGVSKEYSILIIEDYPDLKNFLKNRLSKYYEILEADNGNLAIQQAFETVPDLIICDVMIPGKDGLELTNIFKSDIRTSHIPIILLTAKNSVDAQIEGMKYKADSYITKPFNQKYLEENIKSLLANRSKLKEHYSGEIPSELKTQTISKLDRKFINEFHALIESNIANENFSVEDICKHIGISRMQLYRKIKALLNCNANEYLLNKRLQKAKYLLQHEELTIAEVAYKVGFSSPAYFSTVFKSKFDITPSEFKEKMNIT